MDTSSTDAMHWAKNLVATAKENNFTLDEVLDESWLVGWFANYWAAVHDPLKAEVERLKETLAEAEKDYTEACHDAVDVAKRCAEIAEETIETTILGHYDADVDYDVYAYNTSEAIRKEFGIEGRE